VFPPVIAGIPNEAISPSDVQYGPVWFVVGDLNSSGVDDAVDPNGNSNITFDDPPPSSDNPFLVPADAIHVDQILNMNGRTFQVTVFPDFQFAPGRAVITITAKDPQQNRTSTSLVLYVTDPNVTNMEPSITGTDGTWIEQDVAQNPNYVIYHFNVADSETLAKQLLVTATSSNAQLVPNDTSHLTVGGISDSGNGTLKITPVLPLPSPSPGVPQSATITLSVTDDAYTRRTQFLYVAKNSASAALSFSRPTGVWNLDPDNTQHRGDDAFLNGEMRRISWRCIANDDPTGMNWDWFSLDDAYTEVYNQGRDLSINLIEEPCYIADHEGVVTWCDTNSMTYACATPTPNPCPCTDGDGNSGIKRALPWDSYLQQQRKAFLAALASHRLPMDTGGNTVADEIHIPIINSNLPGGNEGIRELNNQQFSDPPFTGYTRPALLAAVQTELRAQVGYFPNKFIHIGFFIVEDDLHPQSGEELWHYLYSKLTSEFNGIKKPRVHFFQEDLAAARLSAAPDYIPYIAPPNNTTAYSFTPNHCQLPSFAFPCGFTTDDCDPLVICPPTDAEYNNGITYQANTPWSAPAMPISNSDDKVLKTLNGTPNDGMEGAFNNYLNEHLEVYPPDLDHAQQPTGMPSPSPSPWDHAKWKDGLQSWHDYLSHLDTNSPLDAPAGLTVARDSATSNTVSWYGVYQATSYTLQSKSLSPPGNWSNVIGCDPASTTCTDTASTGSRYAYRVRASNADGTLLSPWAQVAAFVSEADYDGYVSVSNGVSTPVPNAAQPGIQAGQGSNSNLTGVVSFDTGILTAGVTVLNAKLRFKQYTDNSGFDALGPCIVDIRKGPFNANEALEGDDFDALETDMDVASDVELTGVDSGNWVEAQLDADYISDINTEDRTQFRLWFPQVQGAGQQVVGWYSGESTGSEPHLVVQYAGP
jgi:hypothetical protein